MMKDLIRVLHDGNHSLVVANNGNIRTFDGRGVADLYALLERDPGFLKGAAAADKVVGKGAAALMVSGGIKALYAEVISEPALALMTAVPGIRTEYGTLVPQISNRTHTGMCPVEQLCLQAGTAEECLPLIKSFINSKS